MVFLEIIQWFDDTGKDRKADKSANLLSRSNVLNGTLLSHNQPESLYIEKGALLGHGMGNVFLGLTEAKEMAQILLFSLIPTNSRKAKSFVSQVQIDFLHEQLKWYPFVEESNYFREENTGYAIQENAIDVLGIGINPET